MSHAAVHEVEERERSKRGVHPLYDRFYAGDVAGVLGMISPDAYVYFQGRDNPQSGEYQGIDGGTLAAQKKPTRTSEP